MSDTTIKDSLLRIQDEITKENHPFEPKDEVAERIIFNATEHNDFLKEIDEVIWVKNSKVNPPTNTLHADIKLPLETVKGLLEQSSNLTDSLVSAVSRQIGNDLSEIIVNGHRGSTDPFLAQIKGFRESSIPVNKLPDGPSYTYIIHPMQIEEFGPELGNVIPCCGAYPEVYAFFNFSCLSQIHVRIALDSFYFGTYLKDQEEGLMWRMELKLDVGLPKEIYRLKKD